MTLDAPKKYVHPKRAAKTLLSKCYCPECGKVTVMEWLIHGQRKQCRECDTILILGKYTFEREI